MSNSPELRINATPSKRIYRSIIADYGLETAIAELVDNAYDAWILDPRRGATPEVSIDIDIEQQSIKLQDNSGGVRQSELKKLISPGASSLSGNDETIGIFGVGCKRAAVALAQNIRITTRFRGEGTYRVEYDDEWLASEDWDLPYKQLSEAGPKGSTTIQLSQLRFPVTTFDVEKLHTKLAETYAHIISKHRIKVVLNGADVKPRTFEEWSYPPDHGPQLFRKTLISADASAKIKLEMIGGLRIERENDPTNYGVYFYCNDRLISRAVQGPEVGFGAGSVGVPHHVLALARVIVRLNGPSSQLPWNSSKSGINYNHDIFKQIQGDIIMLLRTYTQLSRRLSSEMAVNIEPYKSGTIKEEKLGRDQTIKPSKLPAIPKARKSFKDALLEMNKTTLESKPWVRGLCEGMILDDLIGRQKILELPNRLSLVVLDSTAEIGLKDYLAQEIPQTLSDAELQKLFSDRLAVHNEVAKTLRLGPEFWKKMEDFYKLRCDLVNKKVTTEPNASQIDAYRRVVRKLLNESFGLKFPRLE